MKRTCAQKPLIAWLYLVQKRIENCCHLYFAHVLKVIFLATRADRPAFSYFHLFPPLPFQVVLALVLGACVASALQSNDFCPGEASETGQTARSVAAALNVCATLVACMSPTQRQRFKTVLHLAIA